MKILFTSHRFSPDVGGIEINSEILADYFASRGHEIRLLTKTKADDGRKRKYSVYRDPGLRTLLKLYAWSDIVYQNNIEIGSLWPNIYFRKPWVISIHTWLRDSKGKRRMIDQIKKTILSFGNSVISVSEAIRKDTQKSQL